MSVPSERLSILVVDDDCDTRESLALLLQMAGHSVRIAADAAVAVQLAVESAPDVALIDIGMPRINGYELARQFDCMGLKRRPYLIAVTGFGTLDDKHKARAAGFDLHLTKPIDPTALETFLKYYAQSIANPETNGSGADGRRNPLNRIESLTPTPPASAVGF